MMKLSSFLVTAAVPLALGLSAQAQTAGTGTAATSMDDGTTAPMQLPAACGTFDPAAPGMSLNLGHGHAMTGHRDRMMRGMMETHGPMMHGMMNEDPDLAFACGMIAHHQAAIRMSEAQVEFGADAEMRSLAERIIQAQQGEIRELTDWIDTRGAAGTAGDAGSAADAASPAAGSGDAGVAADGAAGGMETGAPSDPSAPAEGLGAGKSTETGGVPMEPDASATPGDAGAAPSDPSAPAEGLGAGKSTETGGVPMEPDASATPGDAGAAPSDPSAPAEGLGAGKSTETGGVPMEPDASAGTTPAPGN